MYKYIGDPTIFSVGDPTIFLGLQYWLHKWLPDPPPEARDAVLLSHIFALTAMLSDEKDRADLQQPVAALLAKRLGS